MNKNKENYGVVTATSKKMGFAEAPHGQSNGEKNGNRQAATIALSDFHLP